MNRLTEKRLILITRPTRLAELVARFNTVSQAKFYVEHQGVDFQDYLHEDGRYHEALRETQSILSRMGRVQILDRGFLANYLFASDDIVVTLGQDGLVANTLKYLDGQPVVGVNPDPGRWDGLLLPFRVGDLATLMPEVVAGTRRTRSVTMAKASLNTGQTLYAVNDLFIGPKSHTSARYRLRLGQESETQSSSGVIVSTGMGSTGWLKSLLTGAAAIAHSSGFGFRQPGKAALTAAVSDRANPVSACHMGGGFAWDADFLCYTVREPFPTKSTGATLLCGKVTNESPLYLESCMAENGVIFSDGMENDFLEFNSGTRALISLGERKGHLVV